MEAQKQNRWQRLKTWLCRLCGCREALASAAPEVFRIVGTNIERWTFMSHDIEAELYTDRIIFSVYLMGKRVLKGWVFHTSDQTFCYDHAITFHPNYKLRRHLIEYAEKRLKQHAAQHKDMQ